MRINRITFFLLLLITAVSVYSQIPGNDKNSSTQNPMKSFDLNVNTSKIDLQNFDILKQIEPGSGTGTIYNDQLLEGAIDANTYLVGPNDIFSLGVGELSILLYR